MRRSFLILSVALLLLLRAPVSANELLLGLFERYLDSLYRQTSIPGLATAIVGENGVLWERGFGLQDVERSIATRPDTPFHIDGNTQLFTAALTLRCVEENRLYLDEPVSGFQPDSPEPAATIGQLLSHTSNGPGGLVFAYRPERLAPLWRGLTICRDRVYRHQVADLLDRLAMRDAVPGADAVDLPENAEGKFEAEQVERYREVLQRQATPYAVDRRGRPTRSTNVSNQLTPSAGLIASVRDLAQFEVALRKGVLVRPETLQEAWRNPIGAAGRPLPHGLGWFSQIYSGELVVWQFGVGENASSSLIVNVPARRLTFIALANSDGLVRTYPLAAGDVTVAPVARLFLRFFVG
jgi:CubicO group peptidase (beta-lactamase class C family)